ncbi:MAG: hypothetical protein AB1810_07800 [Pseudomonadota bacterium]
MDMKLRSFASAILLSFLLTPAHATVITVLNSQLEVSLAAWHDPTSKNTASYSGSGSPNTAYNQLVVSTDQTHTYVSEAKIHLFDSSPNRATIHLDAIGSGIGGASATYDFDWLFRVDGSGSGLSMNQESIGGAGTASYRLIDTTLGTTVAELDRTTHAGGGDEVVLLDSHIYRLIANADLWTPGDPYVAYDMEFKNIDSIQVPAPFTAICLIAGLIGFIGSSFLEVRRA